MSSWSSSAEIMHRRRPAVRVEPLRRGPAGIFRHRVGRPAFRLAGRRAQSAARTAASAVRVRGAGGGSLCLAAPAEADRGQPLHQRHAALLRMIVAELAALRLDLVLRRQRQLVDARHARRARHARSGAGGMKVFGSRRLGLRRFAGAGSNSDGFIGIGRIETSSIGGRRQKRGGDRGMGGGFDRSRAGDGRELAPGRRALDALGDAAAVGAHLAGEFLERGFRLAPAARCMPA